MGRRKLEGAGDESTEPERAVLEILNRWDPFPGPFDGEYQRLAGRIVAALRQGSSAGELETLLMSDMESYFGTAVPEHEIRKVRLEIFAWWRNVCALRDKR